jgi:hypothetical protein
MRTTVTLDRDLEAVLRDISHRTRRPFKQVLNQTLRAGLTAEALPAAAEPFVLRSRSMQLRAGLDPVGFNKLADDLEAEAFLETTRALRERKS